MKIHKQGCMANISCLVIHPDGVCPGPYGQCTCDSLPTTNPWSEIMTNEQLAIADEAMNGKKPMSKLDELDIEINREFFGGVPMKDMGSNQVSEEK